MKCLHKGVGPLALLAALALSVAAGGCSSASDAGRETATGKVSMQLTGQTNGNSYRLRNARFDVAGPQSITLDSESDLTAATLNATLSTGNYTITLEPGWSLERNDMGTFEVVNATLASMNPQSFQILGGGTTNVAFQFSTDGTLVTIGTGQLSVSIGITETGMSGGGGMGGGGGSCTIAPQSGCAANQACYYNGSMGLQGSCAPAGTVAPGGACVAVTDCAGGGICAVTDPTMQGGTCLATCAVSGPNTCPAGQTCFDLGVGGLGACAQ